MSITMTTKGIDLMLNADIDFDAVDLRILAVTTGYTFDPAHDFLDDVDGGDRIGSEALTGVSVTNGLLSAADVTIPTGAGDPLGGFWIYQDIGSEATSPLLFWYDKYADNTSVSGTTTANGILVPLSVHGIASFAVVPS